MSLESSLSSETAASAMAARPKPAFSVIVPCYNEKDSIRETAKTLTENLRDAGPYEIIMVNDGSNDQSEPAFEEVESEYPQVRVIVHPSNRGYGAALKTGIRQSNSDVIVITDADGTYPIDRIPELVEEAKTADMIVGARTADDVVYPLIRKIPKFFLVRYASWMAGQRIPDLNSGLRVMRKPVLERFLNILPDGFSFTTTITLAMMCNNYLVRYIPITYFAREGKSKIRPIRDTVKFFQLILRTGMYFAPMRVFFPIALLLGAAFATSLGFDLAASNLNERTLLLLLFAINTGMFALLADMIDKRTP